MKINGQRREKLEWLQIERKREIKQKETGNCKETGQKLIMHSKK